MRTKVLRDSETGLPIELPDGEMRFPMPVFGGYGEDGSHLRIVHSSDDIRQAAYDAVDRIMKAYSDSKDRLDQAVKESTKKMEG